MSDGSARREGQTACRTRRDGPLPGWAWREARHVIRLGRKEGASAVILQQNGDARFNFFQGACGKPEQSKGLSHETSSKASMDARVANAQSVQNTSPKQRTSRQRRGSGAARPGWQGTYGHGKAHTSQVRILPPPRLLQRRGVRRRRGHRGARRTSAPTPATSSGPLAPRQAPQRLIQPSSFMRAGSRRC